jgi:hypothetical protein
MGSPISEHDRQTSYLEDEDNSSLEFRCIGAHSSSISAGAIHAWNQTWIFMKYPESFKAALDIKYIMRPSQKCAILATVFAIIPFCIAGKGPDKVPTVDVLNGTYNGVHSQHYDQDFFLGVPYAQQPVGDLRLQIPHSLNTSWTESRNATEYSRSCLGYGQSTGASEACLTLNVVRPSGAKLEDKLPVVGKSSIKY